MGLKEILSKISGRKEIYKEMKAQDEAASKIEDRKLSAEERALNKILEKRRQEGIKRQLNEIYEEEDNDYWHKDVIKQPNIFKHKATLLNDKKLFSNNKNIFIGGKKWH